MAVKSLHIFCYDITNDRLRARVASALEERGARVQGSVFEIWLTPVEARRLGLRLGEMLAMGDSLRVYPLSRRNLSASQQYGRGGPPNPGEYYLF